MSIDKDLFYESLCKTLDPRSGKILPIDKTNESGWRKVLDIEWKGGIHFMVESSKYCWGTVMLCVMDRTYRHRTASLSQMMILSNVCSTS